MHPVIPWLCSFQGLSYLKGIKQDQMENILDRFDAREERLQGDTVIKQGEMVSRKQGCGDALQGFESIQGGGRCCVQGTMLCEAQWV